MSAQPTFADKFKAVKAEFDKKVKDVGAAASTEAKRLEERYKTYETLRKEIAETIVKPRLEELARQFPGVTTALDRDIDGAKLTLSFPRTPERAALMEITLRLSHDDTFEKAFAEYELRIIPVFMEFERTASLTLSLDSPDRKKLTDWLDERLLSFARTYFSMQFIEQYQRDNLATDPVLARRFPLHLSAGKHDYEGVTYHFASKESLAMFKADPAKYMRLK